MASQAEVADHLDLKQASVSDLVRRGVFAKAARGGYDLNACRTAYIRHLREVAAGRAAQIDGEDEENLDLVQERARLAKEQADKIAMENATRRGESLSRPDVVAMIQGLIAHSRAKFLALPSKLAAILARLDQPREVQDRLTTAIHDCLAELANTRWVSADPGEPSGGGSSDGGDERLRAAAETDRQRVGRPKQNAKPGGKRRAGKVGHKPS